MPLFSEYCSEFPLSLSHRAIDSTFMENVFMGKCGDGWESALGDLHRAQSIFAIHGVTGWK